MSKQQQRGLVGWHQLHHRLLGSHYGTSGAPPFLMRFENEACVLQRRFGGGLFRRARAGPGPRGEGGGRGRGGALRGRPPVGFYPGGMRGRTPFRCQCIQTF
jgi:hypothetical protein